MDYKLLIILSIIYTQIRSNELELISQARSSYLEKYKDYINTILMYFNIREDVAFVSFRFRACDMGDLFKKCNDKAVQLYLKQGSPPIINPDESAFPINFLLNNRSELYSLNFTSNKNFHYINITYPLSGSYYAIAFHPYSNPKDEGITQQGLIQKCRIYIDSSVYARKYNSTLLHPDNDIKTTIKTNEHKVYEFHIPKNIEQIQLQLKNIKICENCSLNIKLYPTNAFETYADNKLVFTLTKNEEYLKKYFWILDVYDYNLEYELIGSTNDASIEFKIIYMPPNEEKVAASESCMMNKDYYNEQFMLGMKYNETHVIQSKNTDMFGYTYEMLPLPDGTIPMTINITSEQFYGIKFHVHDVTDVGGAIQLSLAYKPRLSKKGRFIQLEKEPSNHRVIACLNRNQKLLPQLDDRKCIDLNAIAFSEIELNNTVDNVSKYIPYPEAGDWYLTFRLFCGECEPCQCPEKCRKEFANCLNDCNGMNMCNSCNGKCEKEVYDKDACKECRQCDGNCKRSLTNCNSTIMYDISSYACLNKECGNNGACVFLFADGFLYSTCKCLNNYKGWDCSDDSNANSFPIILLESILLITSNIIFIPAAYVAYKRSYYIEVIVYASTCIASSFYHACDSGENIVTFCILSAGVLQFADFYCALLSIWVTLVAMAYLKPPWPPILHILGAIILAIGTTMDKTSLWVFVIPVTIGFLLIGASWAYKNYKTKLLFPSKRYWKINLPCGLIIAVIAIIVFSLLQTQGNYKYTHSLWHILMATAVIIILPKLDTFLPTFPTEYL